MLAWFKRRIHKDERGITGLETAIILIAFVMVASVFAYVILSAGLFASQRTKDTIHSGLQEVKSTVFIKGDVLAEMTPTDPPVVDKVYITVGTLPGCDPVDFTDTTLPTPTATPTAPWTPTETPTAPWTPTPTPGPKNTVIVSYSDAYHQYANLTWTLNKLVNLNKDNIIEDNLLDPNEIFQLCIDMSTVNDGAANDAERVGRYHTFTIQITPPSGPVITIERTVPSRVTKMIDLY